MANQDIGEINCAWCGNVAPVRKASRGRQKLYLNCPTCGQQWMNTQAGQDIILERAKMYGAEGKPEPVNEPEPPPKQEKPVNEPAPQQKPKRFGGFFDFSEIT